VKNSSCPDAIFLVRYMSNPMPLVKKCDYFVLSSLYEGFGLVLVEADVLGLPCFSTDIVGPQGFMRKYDGLLVADSEDGIVDGMRACLNGTVPARLNIDYEQYNREAIEAFESQLP
jgi:CDP-glycerol glycerophosphotransferase